MCGEGDWVGALVNEVNAGGEVCWRGSRFRIDKTEHLQNYLSGARASALHGGGQKVPGENPAEGVLAVGVQIR